MVICPKSLSLLPLAHTYLVIGLLGIHTVSGKAPLLYIRKATDFVVIELLPVQYVLCEELM